MSLSLILLWLAMQLGVLVLFFVAEFHHIRRGRQSWQWVHRLYNRYDWIRRVRW